MVHHSRPRVAHKIDKSFWYQVPGDKRDKWYCRLCGGGGRGSKAANRHLHEATSAHKAALQHRAEIAQAEESAAESLALGPTEMRWTSARDEAPEAGPQEEVAPEELRADLQFIDEDEWFENRRAPMSMASLESTASSDSGGWDGMNSEDIPLHTGETFEGTWPCGTNNLGWWPFRAKEYLISSLVIGHTRTIISQVMYQHVRLMFSLCGTCLPDWTTVRRGKTKLRKLLNFNVIGCRSVLNRPVHYLSLKNTLALEIANPMVEPHLKYYPELAEGRTVSRLSQSRKWLKDLGPNTRAQMVRHQGSDYYLHELVKLKSSLIVVPAYFCEIDGVMHALCQTPDIQICSHTGQLKFLITKNPPFDSPQLTCIAVEDFATDYPSMTVEGGGLMSDLCGNQMYGESLNFAILLQKQPWA
ncbi:hypothetical protein PGTUg99_008160 [Puccinia graminis f. sp. tritici]|uniref:Uncharacterized protein n=1 Tax=Puccinia graminis f. sp. tritici TaxID=56615 RepID=A0A5B0RSR0_PUCGR|nr:hypothetical protein PGTUg99_008160 [Puccinia graminis f. sp. tritici]